MDTSKPAGTPTGRKHSRQTSNVRTPALQRRATKGPLDDDPLSASASPAPVSKTQIPALAPSGVKALDVLNPEQPLLDLSFLLHADDYHPLDAYVRPTLLCFSFFVSLSSDTPLKLTLPRRPSHPFSPPLPLPYPTLPSRRSFRPAIFTPRPSFPRAF